MSGFAHDIAGGQGNLIITSMQSPNYSAGSAGWQVRKDGSAEFNNLTIRGTFNGTNFALNSAGLFFYSGTPANGNLIQSTANADGTDAFGNPYLQGTTSYFNSSTSTAVNLLGGIVSWYVLTGGSWQGEADIGFQWNNLTGGSLLLQAGNQVLLGQNSTAIVDDLNDLVTLGRDSALIADGANNRVAIALGALTNVSSNSLGLPAGGGPFIPAETFHTVSNGTSFSGTMRVKLLPWNAVWLDVQISYSGTAAVTANFGSLPSSAYYPAGSRQFGLSCTQAPTAITGASTPRVFVPTSGALQVVIPQALAATGAQLSLSVMFPNN